MKNALFQLLARLEIAALENHQYTNALPNMAELLTAAAIRPPVVASAINSGGSLEQRLKMMITEKTWKISCSLRMAIVAFATCVFPLGFVHAQDFKAVEQRLGGAVEAGELSLEQAKVMMDALRRSGSQGELAAKKQRFMQFTDEIKSAVKAGKLSEEEAEMKLSAVKREMFEGGVSEERELAAKKQRFMQVAEEIKFAVKAGKLSEEDAEMKLSAVKREMFEGGGENRELAAKKQRYLEIARKIEAAVEAGDLSTEEAEKKLIAVRHDMFEQGDDGDHKDSRMEAKKRSYMEAAEKIEAEVKTGALTKEAAKDRLVELKKRLFSDGE